MGSTTLLKDILAFANAWRQTDAHILIGVQEIRGARSKVVGVTHHLLNRNLQQFVHSKTNRPVDFSYAPFTFEGVEVGVLAIPLQERPLFLLKDYGALKGKTVYIRRSDTTGEAAPDEVARMGSTSIGARGQPVLEFEFADLQTRQKCGCELQIKSPSAEVPEEDLIPLYGKAPQAFYGISLDPTDGFKNRSYYRELAVYIRDSTFLCPIGLAITNHSTTVAEEVVVTIEIDSAGVELYDEADKPLMPSRDRIPTLRGMMSAQRTQRVLVSRFGDLYEVKWEAGTVQPGTSAWSKEPFHIGARQTLVSVAKISVSANNLRVPIRLSGEISIEATSRKLELKDFVPESAAEE
jgi:Putative DNA-binding domain